MIGTPATLEQILANKERRFHKQQALLKRFSSSFLISLSINIPSAIKLSHESLVIFKSAYEAILKLLNQIFLLGYLVSFLYVVLINNNTVPAPFPHPQQPFFYTPQSRSFQS